MTLWPVEKGVPLAFLLSGSIVSCPRERASHVAYREDYATAVEELLAAAEFYRGKSRRLTAALERLDAIKATT